MAQKKSYVRLLINTPEDSRRKAIERLRAIRHHARKTRFCRPLRWLAIACILYVTAALPCCLAIRSWTMFIVG